MTGHALGPEGDDGLRSHGVDDRTHESRTPGHGDTVASTISETQPVMLMHAHGGETGGQLAPPEGGHPGGGVRTGGRYPPNRRDGPGRKGDRGRFPELAPSGTDRLKIRP